ncbi:MAG: hypothetical protein ACOC3S_03635 [Bacteroidota bacterium]
MLGWILYKASGDGTRPESYEINRLVEVGKNHGIDIKVLNPKYRKWKKPLLD